MIGDTRNYQHRSCTRRSRAASSCSTLSYMEIYNDRIYDLLKGQQGGATALAMGSWWSCRTRAERTCAASRRSRSAVSRRRWTSSSTKSRAGGTTRVTLSKLHLLDLAGSERLKKTTIKKESIDINQCLSFLEQCMVALGSKKQRHTPYRQMKLTNVLKDSLGGNSNTLMFACIWGECRHLEETISTLKLAQRMMRVQNEYERQIRELKHELVMHDALVERPAVVYDEHTPEQKHQLLQMVRRYIDAPTQEMEDEALRLTSVNEVRELFRQFKLLFRSSGLDSMGGAASGMNGSGSHGGAGNANASTRSGSAGSSASRTQTSAGSRDDLRMHATHGPTARNCKTLYDGHEHYRGAGGAADGPGGASPTGNGQRSPAASRSPSGTELPGVPDNNEDDRGDDEGGLYSTNKSGGRKLHQSLQGEKDKRFDAKQRVKQVTRRVNAAKAQIDAVRAQLEDKRNQRGTHEGAAGNRKTGAKQVSQERDEVVDEEEFMLMAAETRLSIAFRRPSRSWNFHFAAWSFYDDDLCVRLKTGMTKRVTPTLLAKRQVLLGLTPSRDQRSAKMLDDGEKFDQMEVDRVRAKDPASLAFSQAQKKMRQQQAGAIVPASERKAKLDSLLTIQRRTRNQRWFDCV
ncbi:hypothetical protein PR003_g10398 [Phytophthora rubi]|nr:hypothetical protein PR003_g10398 [Phytophthora rubi]